MITVFRIGVNSRQERSRMSTTMLRQGKCVFVMTAFLSCLSWLGCTLPPPTEPKSTTVPPALMYELGMSRMESGEYLQARLSFEEAVSLDPNSSSYRNALGLANLQLGRLPQALSSFREAVRLNPNFSDGYNNLGVALAQSGKWEEAIAAFEKVLAFPFYNRPEIVYQNLGWAYYSLGRYQEAEKALSSALSLEPRMALTHYTLGLLYEKQGRQPDAVQAYRQVVKLAAGSETGRKAQERLKALGQ